MITLESTPIKGDVGTYENVFPSQSPVIFSFNRKDTIITQITSGTDNKVLIQSQDPFTGLEEGDFVTWKTDSYPLVSTRVISIVNQNNIEVDYPFSSTNTSNGFINFKKRWYLEARYVRAVTLSNEQNAIPILDYQSQLSSAKNGDINLDVSLLSDLIEPELDLLDAEQETFSSYFKIQYRESWEDNRSNNWISPEPDVPILLIHGSKPITSDGFLDEGDYSVKFWRGYPFYVNYVHSDVNDQDTNRVVINGSRYSIDKQLLSQFNVSNDLSVNGLLVSKIEPSEVFINTTFLTFEAIVTSEKFQYDPEQYDPEQYA